MALVRLVLVGAIVLTICYFAISAYSRSVRREKLENRWDEEHPDDLDMAARDTYIAQGMDQYENGLRKRLILLVYVIPVIAVGLIIWFTNY
ncbi:hypothetical protein [Aestuariibius sp. HNIBRBA575]|uniref:hypothetical protein n=1 Tax=Aestuariibius sp. HNIBRBA575 TaxID=3233343 RepID=UPI0034A2AD9D